MDAGAVDALTAETLRARGSLKWNAYPGTLGAWVAEMDFPLATPVREVLRRAADNGALGYLRHDVAVSAKQACADWYRRETGWQFSADDVWLIPDVLEGLKITLDHVAGPGSVAVVTTPAYMPFLTRPQALGHEVVLAPAARGPVRGVEVWVHDLEALDAGLAAAAQRSAAVGARAVLILCNPWNPVGRVLTEAELREIAAVARRHNALVFSDEIHAPLRYRDSSGVVLPHVPFASLDGADAFTVTAVSASKAWNLAGLKCAQLIATGPEVVAALRKPAAFAGVEPATPGVLAAVAAYADGQPWLDGVLAYLDGNRTVFAEEIATIPGAVHTPPEGTYLAWVDLTGVRTGSGDPLPADLGAFFRERGGVTLTDGALCGAPGSVRLNLALPRPLLVEAVRAMAAAISAA